MDCALRNTLAVLVRKLLQKEKVLHQDRATRARRDAILVVGNRHAAGGGECWAFGHEVVPVLRVVATLTCKRLRRRSRRGARRSHAELKLDRHVCLYSRVEAQIWTTPPWGGGEARGGTKGGGG